MVKKKKDENIEIKPEELLADNWINTPYSYIEKIEQSKNGKILSLMQQSILIKVSEKLQNQINAYYQNEKNKGNQELSLFKEEELIGMAPIRIKLSELGIGTSNYGDINNAIDEIEKMQLRVLSDDKKIISRIPLFGRLDIPVTPKGYQLAKGKDIVTYNRSAGWIDVTLNYESTKHLFNMSKGYIKHVALIAQNSKKANTPDLYFFLKRNTYKSEVFHATAMRLRDVLGMIKYSDDGEIEEMAYPKFSQFYKQVILKVQGDIERMAQLNQVDITFTCTPVYLNDRPQKGEPDYLEFVVKPTQLGIAKKEKDNAKKNIKVREVVEEGIGDRWTALRQQTVSSPVTANPVIVNSEIIEKSKKPSKQEVYKERWGGIVAQYDCIIGKEQISRSVFVKFEKQHYLIRCSPEDKQFIDEHYQIINDEIARLSIGEPVSGFETRLIEIQ